MKYLRLFIAIFLVFLIYQSGFAQTEMDIRRSFRGPAKKPVENDIVTNTGIIVYLRIEGGHWAIRASDGRTYLPVNLPDRLKRRNFPVRFTGRVLRHTITVVMCGIPIKLIKIEKLSGGVDILR